MFSRVLLPLPLAPTMATTSPGITLRSSPRRATLEVGNFVYLEKVLAQYVREAWALVMLTPILIFPRQGGRDLADHYNSPRRRMRCKEIRRTNHIIPVMIRVNATAMIA